MYKSFFKSFFYLLIALYVGCSQFVVFSNQGNSLLDYEMNVQGLNNEVLFFNSIGQSEQWNPLSTDTRKNIQVIEVSESEVDEDESASCRKTLVKSTIFKIGCSKHTLEYFFRNNAKIVSFFNFFINTSSSWFKVFQVYRI